MAVYQVTPDVVYDKHHVKKVQGSGRVATVSRYYVISRLFHLHSTSRFVIVPDRPNSRKNPISLINLLAVEKPARYMGGEMGSVRKDAADLLFALAFPDVYEVGMSHLGLRILYHILNGVEGIAAERVFAPWPDMERQLLAANVPLATLESGTPLAACDIIGFTLQYELSYTNILTMLRLGSIPLLSEERDESFPLILAGGPCAYNPEPLAPFFDAVLLGDGEEAVLEIARAVRDSKRSGENKTQLLERLSVIAGVYIPAFFEPQYAPDGTLSAIIASQTGLYIRPPALPGGSGCAPPILTHLSCRL